MSFNFLYPWHDIPGIDHAAHPGCVKSIIIPQMKMLVRQNVKATDGLTRPYLRKLSAMLDIDETINKLTMECQHTVYSMYIPIPLLWGHCATLGRN
jgi:hypothetical protein